MTNVSFATFISLFVMAAGLHWARGGEFRSHGILDELMIIPFFLLMWWLLRERRQTDGTADAEGAENKFALRLGKSLNGVIRRFRGSA